MKKVTAVILTMILSGATVAGTMIPASANTQTTEVSTTATPADTLNKANQQQIVDVFNGINAFRANKGLPPVTFNVTVSEVAEDWSDYMATNKQFYHNPNYAGDPRVDGRWSAASEIIAARWDTNGQGLVDQWNASPSHNSVMSDPNLKVVGIGISVTGNTDYKDSSNYMMYGTANFFKFGNGAEPAGAYTTAQDYFDGKPSNDTSADTSTDVTATTPTWDDKTGQYTIPSSRGVDYFVNGVIKPAGVYDSGWTYINVDAKAQQGYRLFGAVSWDHKFVKPLTTVTPNAPVFDEFNKTYTIPSTAGVTYVVRDETKVAGVYPASGLVMVYAYPEAGHTLTGTTEWIHEYAEGPVAPTNVTPTAPTFNASSYVIPTTKGVEYSVNGVVTAAGTYTSKTMVNVTTTAITGYALQGTTKWSKDYTPAAPLSAIAIKAKEINGSLGLATSREIYGLKNGGGYQNFQRGAIIWSPATGARISNGAIRTEYGKTGFENGRLGYPTSDPYNVAGGVVQNYQGGKIAWSSAGGARVLDGVIGAKWTAAGGANSVLGMPTSNKVGGLIRGGFYQSFQRGAILWSPATGARVSSGAIRAEYGRAGFERGRLGYPKSDEYVINGIAVQDYEGGRIAYTARTGARVLDGVIGAKWSALGGPKSALGAPTTNKTGGLVRGGVYQNFQRGAIVWSSATGAYASTGAIRGRWLSLSAERGRLGYPTSNEYAVTGGLAQNYQGGKITWNRTTGRTAVTYK